VLEDGQTFEFTEDNPAANAWLHPLREPADFDDLKQLVGVPNEVYAHNNSTHERIHAGVSVEHLEQSGVHALADQQSAAHRLATNLVYSYADAATVSSPAVQALIPVMLAAVRGMNAVVGTDLIVKNGATVDLGPHPVVTFDRIVVEGTGRIIVHNNQKVSASSIQWIPNPQVGGRA
jgi:hypothetical protein